MPFRRTSLLVAVAFLSAPLTALLAQASVTGHVTASTGEPLAGATVSVSGTTRGTVTHGDGRYQIVLPPGRYELRARYVGYRQAIDSVTVVAGQSATQDFSLERSATSLEAVAVVGTRGSERTVISAPVPVDVLSAGDIQQSGRVETAQMIQAIAPSFNFPRASIGDGTDHVRPATLRGLAPDQTLVLINGKRRHTSALVNVNGFVGRGAAAVDLNAIPASMIDHIEILRDGAAAQYGSDAIAGVINIVLKSNAPAMYSMEAGENFTTYNRAVDNAPQLPVQVGARQAHDGKLLTSAANYGFSFGENGFLQVGGELRDRGATNRTLPDPRQQYATGDPRNALPALINHRQGDAYTHDVGGFFNAGTTLASGMELYGFGGLSKREGDAAGFWRRPLDDRTLRNIYPNGFLPLIQSNILDGSIAGGVKGNLAGWRYDLGTVYGQDRFHFQVANSANVSLGPTSKTSFDAGALRFHQSTTNLDLFREIGSPFHSALRTALGAEFRAETYGIVAGEPDSYRDGGQPIILSDGTLKRNPDGTLAKAPVGAQVFPGFQPKDAGDHSRSNVAAYTDLEADVTSALLVGVAGRYEHYSDFGSTTNGKVTARFEPVKGIAFRGAASTGFKAPSLAQQYFSSTATNFNAGVAFDVRTFPVRTAEAQVLGASPLKPERSRNYSAGVALEPTRSLATTVDFYRIDIDDRIVLSDNFTGAAVQALFAARGLTGVSGGRFFTNAIDTRTNGVDIVTNYGLSFQNGGVLRLTGGYNASRTKVVRADTTPTALKNFQEALFGRVERARIEKGQPANNLVLSAMYDRKQLGATVRTQRFGKVTTYGSPTDGSLDQTFGARWVSDVSGSWTLDRRYTLTIGADNIFDVYPDRNNNIGNAVTGASGGNANFGVFPYSGVSPFGFNGRFIYTKLTLTM